MDMLKLLPKEFTVHYKLIDDLQAAHDSADTHPDEKFVMNNEIGYSNPKIGISFQKIAKDHGLDDTLAVKLFGGKDAR